MELREEDGAEVLWMHVKLSGVTTAFVRAANSVRSGEEEGGVPMGVLGSELQGVLLRAACVYGADVALLWNEKGDELREMLLL